MRRQRWVPSAVGTLAAILLVVVAGVVSGRAASEASASGVSASISEAIEDDGWPVRVLVAGDSTGVGLTDRLERYALLHPGLLEVVHSAFPGCGLTSGDDGRLHSWDDGREWIDLAGCMDQWESIPGRIRDEQVDAVVISTAYFDGDDILLADGSIVNILDPVGRRMVEDAYSGFADMVGGTDATLMWVTPPDIDLGWDDFDTLLDDPARWSALRDVVDGLDVTQVDLPGWLAANALDGEAGRPDGSHLDDVAGDRFVVELLGPMLLASGNPLFLAG